MIYSRLNHFNHEGLKKEIHEWLLTAKILTLFHSPIPSHSHVPTEDPERDLHFNLPLIFTLLVTCTQSKLTRLSSQKLWIVITHMGGRCASDLNHFYMHDPYPSGVSDAFKCCKLCTYSIDFFLSPTFTLLKLMFQVCENNFNEGDMILLPEHIFSNQITISATHTKT